MIDEIQQFELFWREMSSNAELQPDGLYVHPRDVPFVKRGTVGSPDELQLQVPPIPANGSIRHADVVLFMLNPNFDAEKDATWRKQNPAGAAVLDGCMVANLHQLQAPGDRAFYDVRSDLKDSPGANYWKTGGGFAEIAHALANERGTSLDEAYDEISRRVVILQLVPYRSRTFGHNNLIASAPSSARAHALAHYLAEKTDKLLVVQRKIKAWGFDYPSTRPNVVVYPTKLAISASLSFKGGPGGLPILNRLLGKSVGASLTGTLQPNSSGTTVKVAASATGEPASPANSWLHVSPPGTPLSGSSAAADSDCWPPDRTEELRTIYAESGLDQFLTPNGLNPPGKETFSKLKFLMPNSFRLSSIEFYDLRNGDRYLRIHYAKDAPPWLIAELATWKGFRGSNSSGSNFTIHTVGEALGSAKALAQLLQRHR